MSSRVPWMPPFAAAVVAGGRSRRMGRDKAFLPWHGKTMVQQQLDTLRILEPDEILISGRAGIDYGVGEIAVVVDAFPDAGPMGGIASLLRAISSEYLLVLAVDMPEMSADLLCGMLREVRPNQGLVPRAPSGWEPLAALYPKRLLPWLEGRIHAGNLGLQVFIEEAFTAEFLSPWVIPENDQPQFRNCNTPNDLF